MRLGLRGRSALVLAACIVTVLLLALVAGSMALRATERNQALAFSRNATEYNELRLVAPVALEMTLARQFANSEITRRWLLNESDPALRELFFTEAERYRRSFSDRSYFVGSAISSHYWFNDDSQPLSTTPRYSLDRDKPIYQWFYQILETQHDEYLNVDYNADLGLLKIWINIPVREEDRILGVAGTGLDLSQFVHRLTENAVPGVTPMLLGTDGTLKVHPDRQLTARPDSERLAVSRSIYELLDAPADRQTLQAAIARSVEAPATIELVQLNLQGRAQIVSLSYAPELQWIVATAVDPAAARVVASSVWLPAALAALALLALLMAAIVYAVNRIVLTPLLDLTASARSVERGDFDLHLPEQGRDELGELTRAFAAMARHIRRHTQELETRVEERTRELSMLNEQLEVTHRKLGDSLQYASLIQSAMLPDRLLERELADRHFVFWAPRDVVGGDFYVYCPDRHGFLIGVIDCAGHGVPGALMTMVAHTSLKVAMDAHGVTDPTVLLRRLDERLRSMVGSADERQVNTQLDAGLVYVDLREQRLRFAGAKTSLYWNDGVQVGELRGHRRAVGDRRRTDFTSQELAFGPGHCFYLTSDGLLDQAGGSKGFSFGDAAFIELLQAHAQQSMAMQKQMLVAALAAWQGSHPQRDDITVIGFRPMPLPPSESAAEFQRHES